MIKLELDYYCNDCPYFKAEQQEIVDLCGENTILVYCVNDRVCARMYKKAIEIEAAASIDPDSCE